jgi:IS30 family transposase
MQYHHFSIEEREKIQDGLWRKQSIRSIAKELNRSPSSVSREIKKNLPPERRGCTPRLANERAQEYRTHRGRTERLKSKEIRQYVILKLKEGYSPE